MIPVQSIAESLGVSDSVRTLSDLDSVVSCCLSKKALERFASWLYRDHRAATTFRSSVVPPAIWKRGEKKLLPQASEQTVRLARLMALAEYALNDREQVCAWLKSPHRELGDRTPLDAARTEAGGRWAEGVIFRLFFGLPA